MLYFSCLFLNLRITDNLYVLQDTLDKYLNIQRETLSPPLAYAGAREEDTTRLVDKHLVLRLLPFIACIFWQVMFCLTIAFYKRRSAALPEKEEHLKTLHRLVKDQQKHSQDLSELKAEVKEIHSLLLNLIQSKTCKRPLHTHNEHLW